ncbi:MAG: hypothetical protein GY765_31715 [bacterium]|nr:hypothetical protein [bacterium]
MQEEKCSHQWDMVNVEYGFIITEKCFHCEKVASYFSNEHKPPLEEYREGDHFWNVMESAQSFRFDLKCGACGKVENFHDLMGLMMCTGCDRKCKVDVLMRKLEPERKWVYVAFGYLPINETSQLTEEKIAILEDYFNKRRKTSRSSIKIVSHSMVENMATCYADLIRDLDLLSLTAPEETPAQ